MLQKRGLLQKTPSFSTTCITKMGTMPIQNSFNESKFVSWPIMKKDQPRDLFSRDAAIEVN